MQMCKNLHKNGRKQTPLTAGRLIVVCVERVDFSLFANDWDKASDAFRRPSKH